MEEGSVAVTLLQPLDTGPLSSHNFLGFKQLTEFKLNLPRLLNRGITHWPDAEEKELTLKTLDLPPDGPKSLLAPFLE
jgi:hypothetical protein